jgi:hypothetical protein
MLSIVLIEPVRAAGRATPYRQKKRYRVPPIPSDLEGATGELGASAIESMGSEIFNLFHACKF